MMITRWSGGRLPRAGLENLKESQSISEARELICIHLQEDLTQCKVFNVFRSQEYE